MAELDDWDLLEQYASSGSHAAFEALVSRHAGWVYATARRRVKSPDMAEDVMQATFIVLARKAGSIGRRQSLAAWLYRVANYAAIDALRRQSVRRRHERNAARPEAAPSPDDASAAISQHLDAALDSLSSNDREAVILRYFNNQTLEQIGRVQRVNPSTVQRRIERALAHLGYQLKRNGIVTAPAALAGTLAAVGMCTAPSKATAGLTALATAAGTLPVHTAGPIGLAKGTLKAMTLIKLKLAAAAIAAFVLVTVGGVVITRAVAKSVSLSVVQPANHSENSPSTPPPVPATAPVSDAQFAQKFTSDWQSAQLIITRVNPANHAANQPGNSQILSIECGVTVRDTNNVLGMGQNALQVTRIIDDAGHDVTAQLAGNSSQWPRRYGPLIYSTQFDQQTHKWIEELQPQPLYFSINVNPQMPRRLSLVEGTMMVLSYDNMEQVDVPYVANGKPVSVLPGVRTHFVRADQHRGNYSYEMARNGGSEPFFDGQVRQGHPLPDRLITTSYMIDASGKPLNAVTRAAGNWGNSVGGIGAGNFGDERKIAAMRFEIAVGLHERQVPITLRNIDLPSAQSSNSAP